MTIKAILFDKDGTLIDFDATFAPATAKVLTALAGGDKVKRADMADAVDFDLEDATIRPGSVLIAGSLHNISTCLLPFADSQNLEELNDQVDRLYVKYSLESLEPFPFLSTTLIELQNLGLTLGIATNDSESAAIAHMDRLDQTRRFTYIAGFDSGYGEKPGPGMVRGFADALQLHVSQTAMVGDSPHDCNAGRQAGAVVVAVTSGGSTAKDLRPLCDHLIEDISHLPELIARLNAQ
ncbi:MAG: HAD family hydrolase [Rhizobiaceae bacterium]